MSKLPIIDPKAFEALKNFQLPSEIQGFGKIHAPVMAMAIHEKEKGEWGELKVIPYGPLSLDPCTKVLHYGQEIFEGMKAYYVDHKGPFLFRPEQNAERFNCSATRLGMPNLPTETFLSSVETMVALCRPLIPTLSGQSLYIRPFMIASEPQLGVQPSATHHFIVVASPSASYFAGQVNVMIERTFSRAAVGGTGAIKAGGNYAASALSGLKANSLGYQQVLWLDSIEKKYVEELSAMNFFAVYGDTLVTPALTNTILPGVTRDSILKMAPAIGLKGREERIKIDDLISHIQSGECTEAFACGTASIVAPIHSIGEEHGARNPLKNAAGTVTQKVRASLLDIQEGRKEGFSNWVRPVTHCFQ